MIAIGSYQKVPPTMEQDPRHQPGLRLEDQREILVERISGNLRDVIKNCLELGSDLNVPVLNIQSDDSSGGLIRPLLRFFTNEHLGIPQISDIESPAFKRFSAVLEENGMKPFIASVQMIGDKDHWYELSICVSRDDAERFLTTR